MRRAREEDGQAAVELALVLPLLVLLVTAIVQLGIAFNRYVVLTDAVRVAARAAAVAGGSAGAAQAAAARAADGQPVQVQVQVRDGAVTVTASAPWSISVFGLPLRSGTLVSSTTQAVE